jgi:hypothetical protein
LRRLLDSVLKILYLVHKRGKSARLKSDSKLDEDLWCVAIDEKAHGLHGELGRRLGGSGRSRRNVGLRAEDIGLLHIKTMVENRSLSESSSMFRESSEHALSLRRQAEVFGDEEFEGL